MTMNEKKMNSIIKELEKLNKSLERNTKSLQKKQEACEKLNCNWTKEEFFEHRDTDMTEAQWGAYFDKSRAEMDKEDLERRIANAEKRLERASGAVEADNESKAENERIAKMETGWWATKEQREQAYKEWLENFKAECLKDGIIIDEANSIVITGTTAKGKRFCMEANSGITERSRHCYTLRIDGCVIFTSGDFSTAYRALR